MFINCPHCRALVATDPVTDQPPERCPRCSVALREPVTWSSLDVADAVTQQDDPPAPSSIGEAHAGRDAPTGTVRTMPSDIGTAAPAPSPSELAAYVAAMNAQPAPSPVHSLATWLKAPLVTEVTYTREDVQHQPDARPEDGQPAAAMPAVPPPFDGDAGSGARATARAPSVEAREADPSLDTSNTRDDVTSRGAPPRADAPVFDDSVDVDTPAIAPSDGVATDAKTRAAPLVRNAPSFASGGARGASNTPIGWKLPTTIAALVLLLLVQLGLADRAHLAADPRWRPGVLALCGTLRCSVPAWREPDAFVLVDRNVQPDPATPGVLRVTATFRNDARWSQPWPRLRLTLSDIDGNAVAVRDFAPRDYLGATPAQVELATGQSASIAMDVIEPRARSVAFDFRLH